MSRLTSGFSKEKNLKAALELHFWFYDFARIHGSLRVTPAMQAGISDHVWTLEELLVDDLDTLACDRATESVTHGRVCGTPGGALTYKKLTQEIF